MIENDYARSIGPKFDYDQEFLIFGDSQFGVTTHRLILGEKAYNLWYYYDYSEEEVSIRRILDSIDKDMDAAIKRDDWSEYYRLKDLSFGDGGSGYRYVIVHNQAALRSITLLQRFKLAIQGIENSIEFSLFNFEKTSPFQYKWIQKNVTTPSEEIAGQIVTATRQAVDRHKEQHQKFLDAKRERERSAQEKREIAQKMGRLQCEENRKAKLSKEIEQLPRLRE